MLLSWPPLPSMRMIAPLLDDTAPSAPLIVLNGLNNDPLPPAGAVLSTNSVCAAVATWNQKL